jgi:hypothetical protein
VVFASALTALSQSLLTAGGIKRVAELRERGRIEIESLKDNTILSLTMKKMTEQQRLDFYKGLNDKMDDIEKEFGVHALVAASQLSAGARRGKR